MVQPPHESSKAAAQWHEVVDRTCRIPNDEARAKDRPGDYPTRRISYQQEGQQCERSYDRADKVRVTSKNRTIRNMGLEIHYENESTIAGRCSKAGVWNPATASGRFVAQYGQTELFFRVCRGADVPLATPVAPKGETLAPYSRRSVESAAPKRLLFRAPGLLPAIASSRTAPANAFESREGLGESLISLRLALYGFAVPSGTAPEAVVGCLL